MFQQFDLGLVGWRITRKCLKMTGFSRLIHTSSMATGRNAVTSQADDNVDYPKSDMNDPYVGEKPKCILCQNRVPVTYKNVQLLSQFISPNTGHIYGHHITKLCRRQQKKISCEIKKARHMGFMPVMYRDTIFLKDSDLFGSHYTGNVEIGQAVSLHPRVQFQEHGLKKSNKYRVEKSTESKKPKKK
ncbi:28S ribosomal protein S18c, mitochondrial-like [Anneissia japonica]|uniref:28S ribosomal protein S18c, mitochondrial-like n=1 Tax=Anneissia japonica TaxID=1529436 RepID=UPI0014254E20|nr:28S ribosomal protein S18c, mitochondrial-like [Anneissia japonica]